VKVKRFKKGDLVKVIGASKKYLPGIYKLSDVDNELFSTMQKCWSMWESSERVSWLYNTQLEKIVYDID
jgi:hypothetical protein